MKRLLIVVSLIFFLVGCENNRDSVEPGLKLRQDLLSGNGCAFNAVITADYGDRLYTFSMRCQFDRNGDMTFRVTEPESISDIQGRVSSEEGSLIFDGNALAFDTIADGYLTPISAPWLFVQTLRTGYIRCCEQNDGSVHLVYDDSYEEKAMQVDVYLSGSNIPLQADFLWDERRILSLSVDDFQVL